MKKKFRSVFFSAFILSAVFGIISAVMIFFAPEKISKVTDQLSALGKGYVLPPGTTAQNSNEQDVKILKTFSKVFVNLAKNTRPALVYIEMEKKMQMRMQTPFDDFFPFPFQMPEQQGKQKGAGSGFIVDLEKGYVLTNNHVVEGADKIDVMTFDDRPFKGKVIGADPNNDIAVVQMLDFKPGSLKAVTLGNSDQVEVGDWVVALGAPFQLPQTLTVGVVSAIGRGGIMQRGPQDFIQTDAAINPGNSGGPLLNLDGHVVGINTAIISGSGSYAGIGLAVPANIIRTVAESLINNGKVTRGYLGISMFDFKDLSPDLLERLKIPKDSHGVLVRNVVPGSPAEKANLETYDVIQSVDGMEIKSASQLAQKISLIKPGTTVKLSIWRDGKTISTPFVVGEYKPEDAQQAAGGEEDGGISTKFGLSLSNASKELRNKLNIKASSGVLVTGVAGRSPAASLQFKPNDLIIEINKTKVTSAEQVDSILKKALDKNQDILFLVERSRRNQLMVFRN